MLSLVDSTARNKKYRWQCGHMNWKGTDFAVIRGRRDDLGPTAHNWSVGPTADLWMVQSKAELARL
ncbi:hypothetical protein [Pseudovibrio sp. Ad26]|uniref:hypothetical protein n=1 Tax=Pseudovibrio sp. Ad26 TaxID=989410 RepID=UPI0007B216E2|nr:hypothetical protein [Pseudovibrio sp. Ad26]KZL16535.1 hypothetical protein PsAD26_00310 [Pseudovibrio sp. Ad26]